jgi:hypothetical protein
MVYLWDMKKLILPLIFCFLTLVVSTSFAYLDRTDKRNFEGYSTGLSKYFSNNNYFISNIYMWTSTGTKNGNKTTKAQIGNYSVSQKVADTKKYDTVIIEMAWSPSSFDVDPKTGYLNSATGYVSVTMHDRKDGKNKQMRKAGQNVTLNASSIIGIWDNNDSDNGYGVNASGHVLINYSDKPKPVEPTITGNISTSKRSVKPGEKVDVNWEAKKQ